MIGVNHHSKYAEHTSKKFRHWLSIRGTISLLAEHTQKRFNRWVSILENV
jgi:hypothetical protein